MGNEVAFVSALALHLRLRLRLRLWLRLRQFGPRVWDPFSGGWR